MKISDIDKNFKVNTNIDKKDVVFKNADEEPFEVCAVFKERGRYRRIPESVAKSVSEGVYALHTNTAGGRVRFVTDSDYVAIHAVLDKLGKMPHFAFTAAIGFDLYVDNEYYSTFVPPFNISTGYENVIDFGSKARREICINFPLYSDVVDLYIGLCEGAFIDKPTPYVNDKPVVYYGSSITQGGCASRPGMSYQSIISRELNCDYINLGFSGNARAEDEMIDYIKSLDMYAFVYDYDHNAPDVEHLGATHNKMFCAIREAHPTLPIIIMPRPKFHLREDEKMRWQIIKDTYNGAIARGDKNVYLISGVELTALCKGEGTVDNCHPTDFGFASMANALLGVLRKLF